MYADILPRTIHTSLEIDPCYQTLAVAIERFAFEINLVNYDFGEAEHFWLHGIFRVE